MIRVDTDADLLKPGNGVKERDVNAGILLEEKQQEQNKHGLPTGGF